MFPLLICIYSKLKVFELEIRIIKALKTIKAKILKAISKSIIENIFLPLSLPKLTQNLDKDAIAPRFKTKIPRPDFLADQKNCLCFGNQTKL